MKKTIARAAALVGSLAALMVGGGAWWQFK
jgi:hypothetical protein